METAHFELVVQLQTSFLKSMVCIQGGFGVRHQQVDGPLQSLFQLLGQRNAGPLLGSAAWLGFAKGTTRQTEMGMTNFNPGEDEDLKAVRLVIWRSDICKTGLDAESASVRP